MSETIIGIDFGTTNSLAAVSVGGRALALVDQVTLRPHPSVIWFRGSDIVVGREARQNMDITESGAPPGFVRSPKMSLRREGPIFVDGRPVEPTDAVAEVLKHLKADASIARGSALGHDLARAVFTIPVDFGGPERRALREAARKAGIGVVRVPAYSPQAVAEHTVGLMLMLNRNLHHAYNRNRAGQFVLDGLTGFDMYRKTVGVVGTGAIGRALIDIMLGFGCRVLAYDKFPNEELKKRAGVDYAGMPELLGESHIISLHVPLFEETHHLLDAAAFEQMRDGVMIINTSRGGLIDTPELVNALKSGKVGSAGLDVYEEEQGVFWTDKSLVPLTDDVLSRLLSFPNVVVTSHQAFLTHEALQNIADTTLDNITAYEHGKRGQDLPNNVLGL